MAKKSEACAFGELTSTGVKCPQCQKGVLDPVRGRFGPVYNCTTQGCTFWLDARPTGKKCTFLRNGLRCGALRVEGTKTIPTRCSDRSCPNRHPHKLDKPKN